MRRIAIVFLLFPTTGCGTITATRYYIDGHHIKTTRKVHLNPKGALDVIRSYKLTPKPTYAGPNPNIVVPTIDPPTED